ncbi:Hypothetical protein CINCED_3A011904 [Cinara cedri]|uniref:Uncharacterized protein n=1 Tax=Cinara cedri TaxID=506608 RepID=A0A5E4M641_9HEMI|nr:Hypothetical protein CINCED_3A011904 [Cinara cedri]
MTNRVLKRKPESQTITGFENYVGKRPRGRPGQLYFNIRNTECASLRTCNTRRIRRTVEKFGCIDKTLHLKTDDDEDEIA